MSYDPSVEYKIAFLGTHGKHIRAAPDGDIKCDVEHCNAHEHFTSIPHGDRVLLQTAHGKFLSAFPENQEFALKVSDNKARWEQWDVTERDGKFTFLGAHDRR